METKTKAYVSLALFAVILVALIAMILTNVNILAIWIVAVIGFVIAIFGIFPHSFEGEEY